MVTISGGSLWDRLLRIPATNQSLKVHRCGLFRAPKGISRGASEFRALQRSTGIPRVFFCPIPCLPGTRWRVTRDALPRIPQHSPMYSGVATRASTNLPAETSALALRDAGSGIHQCSRRAFAGGFIAWGVISTRQHHGMTPIAHLKMGPAALLEQDRT